jgi:hypothetical protein
MASDRATISGCCGGIPAAGDPCGLRPPPVVAHRALPVPAAAPGTELADPEGTRWVTLPATGRAWFGEVG